MNDNWRKTRAIKAKRHFLSPPANFFPAYNKASWTFVSIDLISSLSVVYI
jgi:hypothetical protein